MRGIAVIALLLSLFASVLAAWTSYAVVNMRDELVSQRIESALQIATSPPDARLVVEQIKQTHPEAELLTMGVPDQRTVVSHVISIPEKNKADPTFYEAICYSGKVDGWQCALTPKSEIYKLNSPAIGP